MEDETTEGFRGKTVKTCFDFKKKKENTTRVL